MTAKLAKPALDLGVVVSDVARSLAFYTGTLGFAKDSEVVFPGVGVLHRLRVGESFFKLLAPEKPPAARAPGGGITGGIGFRYVTFQLTNLDETVEACRRDGAKIAVEPRALRPGVRMAMVEDPDANTVELLGP
jgi:catechol 2,3-dioxygenase-like lactoylglutathione lyase family enzyme